eukprot:GHVQ01020313.1.p1 GENE.GHVQ01020313.1~~GHVQ01020313.1.p1  ORF type:complete len:371 (+),score=66.31 GHVQ01020313.1:217-1329(+)
MSAASSSELSWSSSSTSSPSSAASSSSSVPSSGPSAPAAATVPHSHDTTLQHSPSLLSSLCPRRSQFTGISSHLMPVGLTGLPYLVLPSRHCLTTGPERSVDVQAYSESLKDFCDLVLGLPTDRGWEELEITPDVVRKATLTNEVTAASVRAWKYPSELLETESSCGLPLYRLEWDWETVSSPEAALQEMRTLYFDPTYVDDESEYSLVEKLPKFKHSCLESPLVFRALWFPRWPFATRDWLEFICVDPNTRSVLSRSCLHPAHPLLFHQHATTVQRLFSAVAPGVGLVRAGCLYCCRLSNPRPGKKGCTVQVCFWYSMKGTLDWMAKAPLSDATIEREYLAATCRQFDMMAHRLLNSVSSNPPFDLLGS